MRENQNLVPNRMQGYSQMSMGSSNLQNLQQQQLQQQQAGAMRGGGGFAPGQNNSQPRAPSGQFASMNPSMQQQYPQQQQGWPQQRQQNPGGMQQNANPYNQVGYGFMLF